MLEEWKPIPNTKYSASTLGRIRTNTSLVVISQRENEKGYLIVTVGTGKERTSKRVNRLVSYAFHGYSRKEVNHKDGDKRNNRPENLEYSTRAANMKHAKDLGLCWSPKGSSSPNAKLNDEQVLTVITYLNIGSHTHVEIGKMFGVHSSTIGYISTGKLWPHFNNLKGII